jgi:hypothetical protein
MKHPMSAQHLPHSCASVDAKRLMSDIEKRIFLLCEKARAASTPGGEQNVIIITIIAAHTM